MDGTLTNTTPVVVYAFRAAFQKFLGRIYNDEEIKAPFGPSEEGIIQKLVPDRSEECIRYYHKIYEEYHAQYNTKFKGMEEALDLLKHDKKKLLAIVTGKGPISVSITVKQLSLDRFFDLIEYGSSSGAIKPELIRNVARKWNVDPQETDTSGTPLMT